MTGWWDISLNMTEQADSEQIIEQRGGVELIRCVPATDEEREK
ncbi:unnamed protein product, partial [Rotaria magnacalcarata]